MIRSTISRLSKRLPKLTRRLDSPSGLSRDRFQRMGADDQRQGNRCRLADALNRNRRIAGKAGRKNAPSSTTTVTRCAAPIDQVVYAAGHSSGVEMKAPSGPRCGIGMITFGYPPSERRAGQPCAESWGGRPFCAAENTL